MPYLGKNPTVGNFVILDSISTVDGQATYNLLLDGSAFFPESANHCEVVVNGIPQSPTTNFNISGSTIVFTGNLVTGDVINYIRVFGDVLNIGTPSDSTVTNAKTNFVSTSSAAGLSIKGDGTTDGTLQLNCSQNSHGIKLASPAHSAGQSYKLIFPAGNVTAGKFLKVDSVSGSGTTGIGTMTFGDAGGGKVLQVVKSLVTTKASTSSSIPQDNTIPQNTEGTEFTTLAITPQASDSTLFIDFLVHGSMTNNNTNLTVCLFKDSAANALQVSNNFCSTNTEMFPLMLKFAETSGTTSTVTYKIRFGLNGGGTVYLNSDQSSDVYSTAQSSVFIITEVSA